MKCLVIGKAISSFVNRSTGEIIDNSKLYVNCDFPRTMYGDVQCFGQRCIEVRIPTEEVEPVEVGETVIISFDDKGKYESLERLLPPVAKPVSGNAEKKESK